MPSPYASARIRASFFLVSPPPPPRRPHVLTKVKPRRRAVALLEARLGPDLRLPLAARGLVDQQELPARAGGEVLQGRAPIQIVEVVEGLSERAADDEDPVRRLQEHPLVPERAGEPLALIHLRQPVVGAVVGDLVVEHQALLVDHLQPTPLPAAKRRDVLLVRVDDGVGPRPLVHVDCPVDAERGALHACGPSQVPGPTLQDLPVHAHQHEVAGGDLGPLQAVFDEQHGGRAAAKLHRHADVIADALVEAHLVAEAVAGRQLPPLGDRLGVPQVRRAQRRFASLPREAERVKRGPRRGRGEHLCRSVEVLHCVGGARLPELALGELHRLVRHLDRLSAPRHGFELDRRRLLEVVHVVEGLVQAVCAQEDDVVLLQHEVLLAHLGRQPRPLPGVVGEARVVRV